MISNATPIICLAKINQLELLKKCFGSIMIPNHVKDEVLLKNKPGYFAIKESLENKWFKITALSENPNLGLGKGENAAINLARQRKDKLIIDDGFAIKVARTFDIPVLRTTTVIFTALQKKIISRKEAVELINDLIDIGYYISPKYYSLILTTLLED